MNRAVRNIISVFLLVLSTSLFAQEIPDITEQQLENLTEMAEEEPENDELLQLFFHLRKNPLDLNVAGSYDLQIFPFLTDLQINGFLQYRQMLGALIDLHELQSVPYWDLNTINKILPFVTVGSHQSLKKELKLQLSGGENQVLLRATRTLEKARGFNQSFNSHFTGDPNGLQMRYRYNYKNQLLYGLTADKDAGEPFFNRNNRPGFDFYSVHFFRRGVGTLKSLAVGDYTINLGQGLIHWQSLAFKKSAEVINVKRQSEVLRPYRAAGEFYFNRGVAATFAKGSWGATIFTSFTRISGNIAKDSSGQEIFTSFQTSGLHRTHSELADRKQVHQHSTGGTISYIKTKFKVAANAVHYRFSKPYQKREAAYNYFAWTGDEWLNASVDYATTLRNIHFFGEAAFDKNFNSAFVNGALISVDPKVDLSFVHRKLTKEYQAINGNAFTESTQPGNEAGFYSGISIRPTSQFKINGYVDFYKFPWLRYRVDAPSFGKDFLLQFNYHPAKTSELYVRLRSETKQINESGINGPTHLINAKARQIVRLHINQGLTPTLVFRARGEMVWFDKKGSRPEEGFLAFVEAHWRSNKGLNINGRLQYFETGGYNSRIYAYENDVLFSYSIPSFFNKGTRYYINVNCQVGSNWQVWLRWSQTIYTNQQRIGSGLNKIDGKTRSDIRLQALYKLR